MSLSKALTRQMKKFGYRGLILPKSEVSTLSILQRQNGALRNWGTIASLFEVISEDSLPAETIGRVAGINTVAASDLSVNVGVDILGSFVGADASSILGLKAALKQSKSISLTFGDIYEEQVLPSELTAWIASHRVDAFITRDKYSRSDLINDNFFVTVAVLKAHSISISAKDSKGHDLGISIPTIKGIAGGSSKVTMDGNETTSVTFNDPKFRMAFAIRLDQLRFNGHAVFERLYADKDTRLAVYL